MVAVAERRSGCSVIQIDASKRKIHCLDVRKFAQRFSALLRPCERSQPARRSNKRTPPTHTPAEEECWICFVFLFCFFVVAFQLFTLSHFHNVSVRRHTPGPDVRQYPPHPPSVVAEGPPSLTNSCNESRGRRAEKHRPSHRTLL